MPNRIIRESALTSHSLAVLSDGAERLFWRLTVVADDHGRFDAYPSTVKAKCFPTLVDKLRTDKICQWLVELSRDHCIFYTVKDRPYGYFSKWAEYQRSYGLASKFPQPPATCGNFPQNPALILIRESRIENRESILAETTISASADLNHELVAQVLNLPGQNERPKGKRPISVVDIMTDKHREFAAHLKIDPGPEWGKFKNYCLAHDKRYANFEAAFRNWLAKAADMKGERRVL